MSTSEPLAPVPPVPSAVEGSGAEGSASGPSEPRAPSVKRYVVKRGDTLWEIARAHAVSPEELRRVNNLSRDATIRPGQELQIPGSSS